MRNTDDRLIRIWPSGQPGRSLKGSVCERRHTPRTRSVSFPYWETAESRTFWQNGVRGFHEASRFTEAQIFAILKEADARDGVKNACRRYGSALPPTISKRSTGAWITGSGCPADQVPGDSRGGTFYFCVVTLTGKPMRLKSQSRKDVGSHPCK